MISSVCCLHSPDIGKDDKKLGVYIAAVESVFLGRARFLPNKGGKFKMRINADLREGQENPNLMKIRQHLQILWTWKGSYS